MLKALIKKQLFELLSLYLRDRKTGKIKIGKSAAGMGILYVAIYICISFSFAGISFLFADTVLNTESSWLYFVLMGSLTFIICVLLNSLTTYSMLYIAKDNEFLLSLPLPPGKILLSRMIVVYVEGIVFQSMVMIPSIIIYSISDFSIGKLITIIISNIALSLIIMCCVCIVGFLLSKIMLYLKNQKILTVIITLCFLGAIYYCQFRLNYFLQRISENIEVISFYIRNKMIILYWMGMAFDGNILYSFILLIFSVGLFSLTYYIMSKNFIKTLTYRKGVKKSNRKQLIIRVNSIRKTLLAKELKKFLSSTPYMLNQGLGIGILIVLSVASVIFGDNIYDSLNNVPESLKIINISHIIPFGIPVILSMNSFSSCSISLEGKTFYLLRSLPIDISEIIRAKINFHIIMNSIPGVISVFCICIMLKFSIIEIISLIIFIISFVIFNAISGFLSNLKRPMLEWTNETIPLKQSTAVAVTIFSGYGLSLLSIAIIITTESILPYWLSIILSVILVCIVSFIRYNELKKKTTKLFNEL